MQEHLRGHILWTPAIAVGDFVLFEAHLAQPKISNPQVPVNIHQYVFRLNYPVLYLQIPIEYPVIVQELNAAEDLTKVYFDGVIVRQQPLLDMVEQLPTRTVVHHEIQMLVRLKRSMAIYRE